MNHLRLFEEYTKWYRGYTTSTNLLPYKWLSSNKQHAKTYSEINVITQGGDAILDEINVDLTSNNILDLTDYDMDDRMSEGELEDFLIDIGVEFEISDIFDIMEDDVPLSRLVNKIILEILGIYDGFRIMESDIETLCIKSQ